MNNIFYLILGITVLFFLLLIIKGLFKKKNFCVICVSVSITWIIAFVLYKLNLFDNNLIIGILMGQSIYGIFYTIENKVKDELKLFRLPFLITLIILGYSLIIIPDDLIKSLILLGILWLIFIIIYFYRNNQNVNGFMKKIVECCKRW